VDEQKRTDTVMAMHANNARRAPGYWLQLILSMGIATLGLVLDSTAVVIGAMLVSPLMGPIIELGMGFAVGSSLLVIRAFFRVAISLLVVVAGAAILTMALPFHQITREISTRTAPTALDLIVAIFCALAAAYATMRNSSDSTVAAAGTAIGIALVPPLCTVGFGIGTGGAAVATGAALLLTANLSAIVVFAGLAFFALGFNQVDAVSIESRFQEHGRADHAASAANRTLRRVFSSRFGPAMRVAIPLGVMAMVAVPLSHALDDVTWEIRTRDAIRRVLEREVPGAVQTSVSVDRHAIALRLLLVGSIEDAASAERLVRQRVGEASGVEPAVSVIPVADSRLLAAAAKAEASAPSVTPAAATNELKAGVGRSLVALWPPAAGEIVGWQLTLSAAGPATLLVRHLGAPLGDAALAMLGSAVSAQTSVPLRARDVAFRSAALVRRGSDPAWADSAESLIAAITGTVDTVTACMQAPRRLTSARDRAMLARLRRAAVARPTRLVVSDSLAWSIRAAVGSCGDTTG
jgi:uncharacterized hydrophobic protein (TIGR00271 family)